MTRTFAAAAVLAGLLAGNALAQQAQLPGQGAQGQTRPGVAQPAARDRRSAPLTGTGRISGHVTLPDGRPLRKVVVRLMGASNDARPLTAVTDTEGRYEFANLPAGRFSLVATKNGYVTNPGDRTGIASRVELADGGEAQKIDIVLVKGCVVAGRVYDEFGDPALEVFVSAIREQRVGGRRRLVPMGASRSTDDLGQFRIYGLTPGDYYVSATAPRSYSMGGFDQPAATEAERSGYAPTYYPGTTRLTEAQRVHCDTSQDAMADFGLIAVRTATISGRVIDSQGRPVSNAYAMLRTPGMTASGASPGASVRADGTFALSGVAPGEYILFMQGSGAPGSREREVGQVPVTVAGADIGGLLVQLSRGARMTGRIVPEPGLAFDFPLGRATVMAGPVDPTGPLGSPSPARVQDDGTFELHGLFGQQTIRASTANWRLKELRVDGQDRTDAVLDFKGNEEVTAEVVLTNRLCVATGSVTDDHGTPVKDATVVVFSEDASRWRYPSRFLALARTANDANNQFKLQTLPPGRYLAVALPPASSGVDYQDPEFLERVRGQATSLTLREGETTTLTLKLTTSPQ